MTSKSMRHFVRTVLNDSGVGKVMRHYWQGHTPTGGDMDEQYGDRPMEEILELQRRALPSGVLGIFARMEPSAATPEVPSELTLLWARGLSGELEPPQVGEAVRDLLRVIRKEAKKEAVPRLVVP